MGKKLLVALAIEGKFTEEGLTDAANEDAGDILTALARELVSHAKVGESADVVWAALTRQNKTIADPQPAAIGLPGNAAGFERPVWLQAFPAPKNPAAALKPGQIGPSIIRPASVRRRRNRHPGERQLSLFDIAAAPLPSAHPIHAR